MAGNAVEIGAGRRLTLDAVIAVARDGAAARLPVPVRRMLERRRKEIVTYIRERDEPAYGFNRGFGLRVDVAVPPRELAALQRNIVRSHSCGTGDPAPREAVRATMLLRAHSLAQGFSGVRPAVVQRLLDLLNRGVTPLVPLYGSVGASGDLAPLSHIALTLIGEGEALPKRGSRPVAAARALRAARVAPLTLEMKEGLALNNGVQFSNALGLLVADESRKLLRHAVLATALSNQVLLGSDTPYDPELLALRPHRGAQTVGAWLRKLVRGSPLREAHRPYAVDGEIQDAYSLRCAPQVLGTAYDLIEDASAALELEANSVTDNPLLLPNSRDGGRRTRIVSGGAFHGMPIAVKLYDLLEALAVIARFSQTRIARFVDPDRNRGLGAALVWPGLPDAERRSSSGMMLAEVAAASLANTVWGAAMPSHLFSLSTAGGQEDHVSMSTPLAVRLLGLVPRVAEIVAIELAFGLQAAHIRRHTDAIPSKTKGSHRLAPRERRLSAPCERALAGIARRFAVVTNDRELSTGLGRLAAAVRTGELLEGIDGVFTGPRAR